MSATIPRTEVFARGYFVPPTIVRGASPDSAIAQRELFGPVLAIVCRRRLGRSDRNRELDAAMD